MADKMTPFVYRRIGLLRQNYIFGIALRLLWLTTKVICITISVTQTLIYLYGDFLHAGKHPLLLIRVLTSSRPIKRVYQITRLRWKVGTTGFTDSVRIPKAVNLTVCSVHRNPRPFTIMVNAIKSNYPELPDGSNQLFQKFE